MWRSSIVLYAALTVITGIIYPLAVTGIAQTLFPHKANGAPVVSSGRVVGSERIGQQFSDPRYFWGRLSSTSPAYNAAASAGSNLGPNNEALMKAARERLDALRAPDPASAAPAPVDLITSSGSGLDPDISPAAAYYQSARVARLRGLPEEKVRAMVARSIEGRRFGVLGEPRVNVLKLNLALDALDDAEEQP